MRRRYAQTAGDGDSLSEITCEVKRTGPDQIYCETHEKGSFTTITKFLEHVEFEEKGPIDKALALIARYGGTDGADHKQWVLDQVARVLLDDMYHSWVIQHTECTNPDLQHIGGKRTVIHKDCKRCDGTGFEYSWDTGTPP